jgi:class 3 adenylate cyclase
MAEERRIVTILFADVVGSTSMGETLDPEDLRHLLGTYFATARGIIEEYGGTVEKFIGDAVMAVFGVPRAHDDDARRASRPRSTSGSGSGPTDGSRSCCRSGSASTPARS